MQLLQLRIIAVVSLTIVLGNHAEARARREITPEGVAEMNSAVTTMVDHIYDQLLPDNHGHKGLVGVWKFQRDGPVDVALIDKKMRYNFTAKLEDAGFRSVLNEKNMKKLKLEGEHTVTGHLVGAHVLVEGFVDDVPVCSINTVKLQLLQPYTLKVGNVASAEFPDKPEAEKEALKTQIEAIFNDPEMIKEWQNAFNGMQEPMRKECSQGMRTFIATHNK